MLSTFSKHQCFFFPMFKQFLETEMTGSQPIIVRECNVKNQILWAPQGFWGSGEDGYLFSRSWGALVIILGEQAQNFGDIGSLAKKQKK